VASRQQGLDPVGATVGQRGARVQAVVAELSGEKIDVIEWSEDAATFVAKALSPAQVIEVRIDEEHRIANVVVPERMLSLAIGREGQNARLAAKLTGWRIDIRSDVSVAEAAKAEAEAEAAAPEVAAEAAPDAPAAAVETEAVAKPKRRKAAAAPEADAVQDADPAAPAAEAAPADALETPAKPKRRKAAKSTEPDEAGEVSP
jgi:N utilization substance protein A